MEMSSDLTAQLEEMKKSLSALEQSEQRCREQLETLRQRYADDLFAERQLARQLREDRHRIQQDYERLRLQKGGFGLKMLLLSGFSGFMSALLLCAIYVWFLKPAPDCIAEMTRFRAAHQLNLERALSERRFEEVEQALARGERLPENRAIRPGLELARKLVAAARQGCQ